MLHPKHWATDRKGWPEGVEVRHVSIGGEIPRRLSGTPSWDGIGEVTMPEGLEAARVAIRDWKPDVFLFGIHMNLDEREMRMLRGGSPGTKCVMHYTD